MTRSSRLETAANISIIVLAVVTCATLTWKFVLPHRVPNGGSNAKPPIGKTINLRDWNRHATEKSVVIVLSTQCHFCSESAPFYRKLVSAAKSKAVPVIAVLPQSQVEAQEYLQSLGIVVDDIQQSPLADMEVAGTPAVLMVNGKGIVTAGWIGKLPLADEGKVLGSL